MERPVISFRPKEYINAHDVIAFFRYGLEIFWGTGDVMTKWGCDARTFSYDIIDIKINN